jgi:hypothetical protein
MKTSIMTGALLAGVVVGVYFLYTSDMVNNYLKKSTTEITETTDFNGIEGEPKEFGVFSSYFKGDLSEEEKVILKQVIADAEEKLEGSYKVLNKEFAREDGDMNMAFIKSEKIRQEIKETLLPYIDELKMEMFDEKYRELGRELESEYILK